MIEGLKSWLSHQLNYACKVPVEVAPCELAFWIIVPAALLLAAGDFVAAIIVEYANAGPPRESSPYRTR